MATWSDSQLDSIHKMLNPESVAIVGATPRMQYGGRFLNAMLQSCQDRVRIYPVNPNYDEIMGVKAYPSVSDLPGRAGPGGNSRPLQPGAGRPEREPREGSQVRGHHLGGVLRARRG